ncbi:MAG: hypothetical protein AUJ52_06925 [Elusimicrobia bacterium CG1_02_63_36]|nr:MAG: hypothetical protein AUJ52_06925 [Elusimicrobia bacterium CG1_02_63_36]PIP82412.1 MAG: hypothetical protein COR54_14925 [Elusimicrobia bacterium CG22_combo_CG10-13_8_21_14_all_63_91]PJA17597.1 MAG: hypothetical protein COX66_03895 [Elusimicrobia bacterium CG_4_10_14_0_2_um_filter_63_34]PJB26560.1 MAG: hypothetical protein CO113_02845 [Elusimicrobia bacterium CG_4_9_14_3_um_filter_62_55]
MNAALLVSAAACLLASSAFALTPAHSPTLQLLRQEASRDVALAAAGERAMTKDNAGAAFDGSLEVPFHVITLKPIGFVEVPGAGEGKDVPLTKPVEKDAPDKDGDPSYHFVGRRIPNLNVVTYTPVADKPGEDGSTDAPKKGGDWRSWAPKLMLAGGLAATVGGIFFPPLLFLGGLLLGAWGMLKLISAKTGGD